MKLNCDKNLFKKIILDLSKTNRIAKGLIEKDYYITEFLKLATLKIPGLVFKGGTSLSKCYKIIDRFSEDIDLTLDTENFSQSKKRNANKMIINISDELGLTVNNRDMVLTHSHGNYNIYDISYPIIFPTRSINPNLKVEMVFIEKAYPDKLAFANSYIGDYLESIKRYDIMDTYDLKPFYIKVQALERTLIDKVFALCDYFILDKAYRNSRHIYDIYKILPNVNINDSSIINLIKNVREDRKKNKTCVSAQDGCDINNIIQTFIDNRYYEDDYNNVTLKLLIKPISYKEVIQSLEIIRDSHIFIA